MTEMVERVAQAIRESEEWSSFWSEEESLVLARAAIEAMRELTERMMDVTGKSITIHGTEFTFCVEDLVKNGMWQAVIDAALGDNVIPLDPIDRLIKMKGMTFPEAVEHLADKKGLS